MKSIAAYMLLVLGGNEAPKAADITALLEKVGAEADAADAERVVKALEGKNLDELIAEGSLKLISVGGSGGGGGGADGGAAQEEAAAPVEEEEEVDVGGGDLFGGGDGDAY
jgi:large subunit ribosomal protein LP2